MHDAVWGLATSDPLSNLKTPVRLQFTARTFHLEHLGGPHGVTSIGEFDGTALTISFRDDDDHHTIGSAVMVGPGIAVSAKHVVEGWLEAITSGGASAVCQAATKATLLLWDVERVTLLDDADIAILSIRLRTALPKGNEIFIAHLTTRMPRSGDPVLLCGFTAGEPSIPIGPRMHLEGLMRISQGKVLDVWPSGRDRVMLPSASFAVDCPAFGGMSGGPVFDQNGHLVGIVSSSSEGEEISYVTHILPAINASFESVWPLPTAPTTLLRLGQKSCIFIHRPDAFSLAVNNGEMEIRYTPWS